MTNRSETQVALWRLIVAYGLAAVVLGAAAFLIATGGAAFVDIVVDQDDGDGSEPDTSTDSAGTFADIVEERSKSDGTYDDRDVTVGGVDYETPSTAPDTPTDTGG